jgi:integrase
MDKLTRKALVDFHQQLLDEGLAPATCNHYVKLVRAAYNKAIEWEIVAKNPAKGIKLFHEDNEVNNRLSKEQLSKLNQALEEEKNRVAASFFKLLILTGARRSELLLCRWPAVDLDNRVLTINSKASKNRKGRQIVLTAAAIEVLKELPGRDRQGWLFISPRTGDRIKCVKSTWTRIKKNAELPDAFRIHDLRHQFASELASRGVSLFIIGQLLGHQQVSTTARYSHPSQSALFSAASLIDDALDAASNESAHKKI